jgi:hypothetical protein
MCPMVFSFTVGHTAMVFMSLKTPSPSRQPVALTASDYAIFNLEQHGVKSHLPWRSKVLRKIARGHVIYYRLLMIWLPSIGFAALIAYDKWRLKTAIFWTIWHSGNTFAALFTTYRSKQRVFFLKFFTHLMPDYSLFLEYCVALHYMCYAISLFMIFVLHECLHDSTQVVDQEGQSGVWFFVGILFSCFSVLIALSGGPELVRFLLRSGNMRERTGRSTSFRRRA